MNYAKGCYDKLWREVTEPLEREELTRYLFPDDMFALALDKVIDKYFAVMASAQQHTFIVLTKRPERMREYLIEMDFNLPLPNVWLGVSVEDQATADERIPVLLNTPAAKRVVSYEPALGPVDFRRYLPLLGERCPHDGAWCHHDCVFECWRKDGGLTLSAPDPFIDWIIMGGESGPKARPMHPDWARSVRDQCKEAGVPFFFKQNGEFLCDESNPMSCGDGSGGCFVFRRVGKAKAGRLLDGVEHNEIPEAR